MESAENEILSVVTDFVKGGDEQDIQKLDAVLHANYRNLQSGFFEQKGVFNIDKEAYLSLIEQKVFGGTPREIHVESVDRAGALAMVKVHLYRPTFKFISFIALIADENGQWKVVGNYPHTEPIVS
ncbi:nuclear transport factor 2 family protein [Parapedobacter tibetensis]|uniref:nuclear transport factor 2 family protein n=1 Tax=Parapedobacter tibetensis TaxID=2972951 RepID=UPI00214D5E06|nr:nuclear transport factor 2 family protein [Parapedobacter tibetensis]